MQKNERLDWRTSLKIAGTFIAFLTGSGFCTGQEILQYFVSYGWKGLLTLLVISLIFLYAGYAFLLTGYTHRFPKGHQIYAYFCGRYAGGFYGTFSGIFIFLSYIIMVAGAGATLHQQYGSPVWLGAVIIAAGSCLTVLAGLNRMVEIIGRIGPVLIFVAMFIGLSAIVRQPRAILSGVDLVQSHSVSLLQAGGNWFLAALSYGGFCLLWLAGFLPVVGAGAPGKRELRAGIALGVIGFGLGCLVLMLGLLADLEAVSNVQIPTLILAANITPLFSSLFSIIILVGIYTASVPLLWQTASRLSSEGSRRFRAVALLLAAVGGCAGLALPFDRLVNLIYVVSGYIGAGLLLFITWKLIRTHWTHMRKKGERYHG